MMLANAQKRTRVTWVDFVVALVLVLFVAFLVYRVNDVLHYRWNWSVIPNFLYRWDEELGSWMPNLLALGFYATLRLAIWGILLASVIGMVMGLCRTSSILLLRMIGRSYVELIRNVPPLVFIFIFYFFISSQIPLFDDIGDWVRQASPESLASIEFLFGPPKLLGNFLSGLIVLALFEGAYITEIVRAGLQSVERGQWEAADSLGLSRFDVMRYVIVPQAFSRVLPPLAGQFISLIKDSSIVSLISIQELTFAATEVANSTQRVFEVWITVSVMYFAICFGCSLLFERWEKRTSKSR
ncbi:amino acid ABC transporter permease [Pelagibius sp. Alg239-R121]|uniref:amino acid ABC transporter permease n=1 Tax=Pelagibius sp. Alg239-R121 TaxID=2993448 RepID=UPI0024A76796|nr:amino acid ABC transporter permease [Pelagibius sp. Alg239-R121]